MKESEVYVEYLALKRHFTSKSYDYHRYNGRVAVSQKQFDGRRGKMFFKKIAGHYDPKGYLLANVLRDPEAWVKDYTEENYIQWVAVRDSMTIVFKRDLNTLFDMSRYPLSDTVNGMPIIVKARYDLAITLETAALLDKMIDWTSTVDPDAPEEWDLFRISKYKNFVAYDRKRAAKIMREVAYKRSQDV